MSRRIRISEDNKHAIAGWEKGDTNNTVMERVYDIHGYRDDPELLAQLYEDQRKYLVASWWMPQHWITWLSLSDKSNLLFFYES
jgi:hypothetical protein